MNDMMNMRNRMLQSFNMPDAFNLENFNFNMPRPEELQRGNATGVCYSSQQFYNSQDPSQNFQKSTQTQFAPGVLEAREAERNNRNHLERMSVRRQLGDRVAEVERTRDTLTGEEHLDRRTNNLDVDDNQFDQEWMQTAQRTLPRFHGDESRMLIDDNTFNTRLAPLALTNRSLPGTEIRDSSTRTSQRSSRSRDTFTA